MNFHVPTHGDSAEAAEWPPAGTDAGGQEQDPAEVRAILTEVNEGTFGAIGLPEQSQTPLCKLGAEARQVQEHLFPPR